MCIYNTTFFKHLRLAKQCGTHKKHTMLRSIAPEKHYGINVNWPCTIS